MIKNTGKIRLAELESALSLTALDNEASRKEKKAKYDLTKKIYSDPKLLDMEYLRAQKKIYSRYVGTVNIHNMDGSDPYINQLEGFVNSALNRKEIVEK